MFVLYLLDGFIFQIRIHNLDLFFIGEIMVGSRDACAELGCDFADRSRACSDVGADSNDFAMLADVAE